MSTDKPDPKNKTTIKPDDVLELDAALVADLEPDGRTTAVRGGGRSGPAGRNAPVPGCI